MKIFMKIVSVLENNNNLFNIIHYVNTLTRLTESNINTLQISNYFGVYHGELNIIASLFNENLASASVPVFILQVSCFIQILNQILCCQRVYRRPYWWGGVVNLF